MAFALRHDWAAHVRAARSSKFHSWIGSSGSMFSTSDTNAPASGCESLLDRLGSAERSFVLLGTPAGFRRDYGHVDMVIGRDAADEVWPRIAGWLDAHSS